MQRTLVTRTLVKQCKFSQSKAKKIEEKIHDAVLKMYDDVVDDHYNKYAFEKLGEIVSHPDLVSTIIGDIENAVEGWDSCVYEKLRRKEESITQEQVEGMKVTKGEFTCRNYKCKSDECCYYTSQTRSLDEPASVYVICTKCGTRYCF
jgi:DNA-directed RNA polymerase subunit M/transcription elongation factor TFIIS